MHKPTTHNNEKSMVAASVNHYNQVVVVAKKTNSMSIPIPIPIPTLKQVTSREQSHSRVATNGNGLLSVTLSSSSQCYCMKYCQSPTGIHDWRDCQVPGIRISKTTNAFRSTAFDNCTRTSAKERDRNQTRTTTRLNPTMHRKSKSKCKTKSKETVVSELVSSGMIPQINHRHYDIGINHNKPQQEPQIQEDTEQPTEHTSTKIMASTLNVENNRRRITDSTNNTISNNGNTKQRKKTTQARFKMLVPIPTLGATSFVTFLTIICIETVLLSTMTSCAKTFYMHWNTSNSIFRIDNTDHIIDVNKGNLAFEFDQVHIICPVYEPGAFENETEKYIIYNVSKVEYETCRITNADPRVIAICDKPQKLMFFTITFRPFTPQPGGLEFLPGNDYYFISTSSKDDLYRRIGGRCSTNNMKVVFKVCCAADEKNRTSQETTLGPADSGGVLSVGNGVVDNTGVNTDHNSNVNVKLAHGHGHNHNTIGISSGNTGLVPPIGNGGGLQLKPINGLGTSINSNIDQFNRVPLQPNIISNNIGTDIENGASIGTGVGSGGIILSPGHGSINMLPPGRGGGVHLPAHTGHHHIQTGIRINNVPTQQHNNQQQHPHHKSSNNNMNSNDDHHNYDKHPNEVVKNEELTYNSGSTRTSGTSNIQGYVWSWIWMGLSTSLSTNAINSTIVLALLVVIIFNHLFKAHQATSRHREEEPISC
ncbi:uncharacterized protein LOC117573205 isoform X1 [Drosophila albomicans]|uniref:Uncharacterized protein LOC117573205 isoform X1 n=1 Tax=Drosophila albomicans TaxID=7291 RepID=A0A6P8X7E0_DROAB|nr:uncharacterized protein LOC117573205 isoform X1 [Drosophila albomicans]XP_051862201.1 uncharacterized protein LOC117573205 isoform X1 [Drosophila albomicans]